MMQCPAIGGGGNAGIAQALQAVDCRMGEATAYAFGRLFGADGRLLPALTLLLTLYVAFFAIGLLTGRTRIGVSALTPRMLTLGLVLTFATSWAAYQNVIWTLTTGAPDEIATMLAGTRGSAVTIFAQHLDHLFRVVASAAQEAAKPAPTTTTGITPAATTVGGFSASTVLWLSALMLLLGTVGVLVTSKIALAAMLAIGPLFIVLALFRGSRGLFEGWLKATVMFALVPLFTVLIGAGAVSALEPIAGAVNLQGSQPSTQAVATLFLGASVYCALMVMALKAATTMIAGWHLPFDRERDGIGGSATALAGGSAGSVSGPIRTEFLPNANGRPTDERIRSLVASLPPSSEQGGGSDGAAGSGGRVRSVTAQVVSIGGDSHTPAARGVDPRLRGVGSRFRERPAAMKERVS